MWRTLSKGVPLARSMFYHFWYLFAIKFVQGATCNMFIVAGCVARFPEGMSQGSYQIPGLAFRHRSQVPEPGSWTRSRRQVLRPGLVTSTDNPAFLQPFVPSAVSKSHASQLLPCSQPMDRPPGRRGRGRGTDTAAPADTPADQAAGSSSGRGRGRGRPKGYEGISFKCSHTSTLDCARDHEHRGCFPWKFAPVSHLVVCG